MADLYGLEASGIDPEMAAKMLGLKSKRAIAEAMLQQSMGGLQAPPTPAGGYAVPISPLAGVAKVLQAYMAEKQMKGIDEEGAKLAGEGQRRMGEALKGYEQTRVGTPESAPMVANDDEGNRMPNVAAMAGNPRQAVIEAMSKGLGGNPLIKADMAAMQQNAQPRVLGRTLVDATGKTLATDSTWVQEQQAAQEAKLVAAKTAAEARAAEGAAQRQSREDMLRMAASLRPPRPDVAPSFTEVLDPKDPTRLLRVDGRAYKGGTVGDVGVLGISGKEPGAAKKAEQVDSGRQTVTDLVTQLRSQYDELEKGGGITTTDKTGLRNVGAGISSSAPGQAVGRLLGTQNQSARNTIAQQRPLLLNAIKNATGMSAKQMDSNVELKMYLAAATDPTLDVQANRNALDMLNKLYGIGDVTAAPAAGGFDADKERRYQEWKKSQGR